MKIKRKLIIPILILIILMVSYISFTYYQIKKTADMTPPSGVPYLIVLGAKVNGTELSLSLRNRAEVALEYLKENPETIAITTGGIGSTASISEAQAVKNYLVKNGIDEDRIWLEEKSTSTYENLQYAKELYGVEEAVIVSNDYHLFRAIHNAEANGIKGYPLAAKTPSVIKLQSYAREYLAILRLLVFNR